MLSALFDQFGNLETLTILSFIFGFMIGYYLATTISTGIITILMAFAFGAFFVMITHFLSFISNSIVLKIYGLTLTLSIIFFYCNKLKIEKHAKWAQSTFY